MAWFITRQLTFDGRIKEEKATKNPWKLTYEQKWDNTLITTYIPKKGELVYLTEKIGLSYG